MNSNNSDCASIIKLWQRNVSRNIGSSKISVPSESQSLTQPQSPSHGERDFEVKSSRRDKSNGMDISNKLAIPMNGLQRSLMLLSSKLVSGHIPPPLVLSQICESEDTPRDVTVKLKVTYELCEIGIGISRRSSTSIRLLSPEKYDGSPDFDWIEHFFYEINNYFDYFRLMPIERIKHIQGYLKGKAAHLYMQMWRGMQKIGSCPDLAMNCSTIAFLKIL